MLIIWLICAFGLLTQTACTSLNTTQSAVTDADSESDANLDLEKAESKDSKQLEIIKQIRRVNTDGSYTVGYEAEDGTFKIESRDVLGNVKGTYGYVDLNGEIKRVSYTANNATNGLKSTPTSPVEEVVHIPRQNRTSFVASTTRRPASLAYLTTSTPSPVRSNAIQAIPKRRILLSSADRASHKNQYSSSIRKPDYSTSTTRKIEPTTTIVYATSVPQKHLRSTTTQLPGSTSKTVAQLSKPDKIEISDRFSKVLNMNKDRVQTEKPVIESSEEKETQTERKPLRGNFLRRQLPDDQNEHYVAQQQVVYGSHSSGEDAGHIYGGVTGTARPVFTSTSSPRIPALVLAARSRAALLKNSIQSTTPPTSTTERVYSKPPRRKSERRDNEDDEEQTTESTSENAYLTQSPIPVQIPPNRDQSQASEDEQHIYRRPATYLPRTRDYTRQIHATGYETNAPHQFRLPLQPAYTPNDYANEQYLRETTDPSIKGQPVNAPENYATHDPNIGQSAAYIPRGSRPYLPPQPTPKGYEPQQQPQQQQQQSFPVPFGGPYQRYPYASPYNNQLDRPLTARDFERLLDLLVVRHQQYQRFNYLPGLGNHYMHGNGFGAHGYNPYSPFGYQQIPRPPLYNNQYDPRYSGYRPPLGPHGGFYNPYTEQENMYQAQNPIPEHQQLPYTGQRLTPRRKMYNPQYFGAQGSALYGDRSSDYADESQQPAASGDYLPSDVREELLYRMLMLAIQPPEPTGNSPVPDASTMQEYVKTTTQTSASNNSKKPVRSVQILGEE